MSCIHEQVYATLQLLVQLEEKGPFELIYQRSSLYKPNNICISLSIMLNHRVAAHFGSRCTFFLLAGDYSKH